MEAEYSTEIENDCIYFHARIYRTKDLSPGSRCAVGHLGLASSADFADSVNAAALAFKVSSDQDFAQQSSAKQDHSSNQCERTQHHQGTVFLEDVGIGPEFHGSEPA